MKKKIYSLSFYGVVATMATSTAHTTQAQTISTIAGTGIFGLSGDGGPATAAQLAATLGMTIDAAGNLYYADYGNNRVRKIDAAGVISTVAGGGASLGDGGAATAASLALPYGVTHDAAGNLYIADHGNNRVRKINTSGIISTIAGTGSAGGTGDGGPATAAKLNGPTEVVLDAAGNIYIADRNNNRIRKVDAAGQISTYAGTGTAGSTGDGGVATAATLSSPLGMGIDNAGNIYIADYGNSRIRKVSTSGVISTVAGGSTLPGASVANGIPATAAGLDGPNRVAVDGAGNIYIGLDALGNKVRVVIADTIWNYAGNGSPGFGGDGGPANLAQVNNVRGLTTDAAGNVYFGDAGNYRIRKITSANHAPAFTGGAAQSISVCKDGAASAINTQLIVNDTDNHQTKTWSMATAPAHGTLAITYSTTTVGAILTPSGLTYTPATGYSGTDVFSVRVTDGLSSDTTTISVTVNPLPAPVVSMSGHVLSTGTFTTYQWLSGSTPIPGATTATYTASADGSYAVAVTDANGCTGTSATQNVSFVGVDNISGSGFGLYPNPATSGKFAVVFPRGIDDNAHVTITNMLGQVIKEADVRTAVPAQIQVDAPAGVYNVSATVHNATFHTKLLMQ